MPGIKHIPRKTDDIYEFTCPQVHRAITSVYGVYLFDLNKIDQDENVKNALCMFCYLSKIKLNSYPRHMAVYLGIRLGDVLNSAERMRRLLSKGVEGHFEKLEQCIEITG